MTTNPKNRQYYQKIFLKLVDLKHIHFLKYYYQLMKGSNVFE